MNKKLNYYLTNIFYIVDKSVPPMQMKERLEGADSFLFQHLFDTLRGKNICNE
jgi:hypothetical protein